MKLLKGASNPCFVGLVFAHFLISPPVAQDIDALALQMLHNFQWSVKWNLEIALFTEIQSAV